MVRAAERAAEQVEAAARDVVAAVEQAEQDAAAVRRPQCGGGALASIGPH